MAEVQTISDFPILQAKGGHACLAWQVTTENYAVTVSTISASLTNILKKTIKFVWTQSCQEAFNKLKAILMSEPVLANASDVGVGEVVFQENDNGADHPVCYFSKKFSKRQKNYSTIEKECLALILSI